MKFFGILLSLGSFMVLDVAADNSWNYGGEIKDFSYIQQCLAFSFVPKKHPKQKALAS